MRLFMRTVIVQCSYTELTKAEVLFRNGEYRNALQVAVDILERLEPGKYEELIKRKEIKSA